MPVHTNVLILAVAAVVVLILGMVSLRRGKAHRALKSWLLLVASSSLAILIGQYAALRCTV